MAQDPIAPQFPMEDGAAPPVRRGMGAAWLAACMAHDMLYAGDIARTVALLRRAGEDEYDRRDER